MWLDKSLIGTIQLIDQLSYTPGKIHQQFGTKLSLDYFMYLESSTKSSAYKIELRGGSNRKEGNVFINGKPVCDDMWDKNDATVACRMLGYVFIYDLSAYLL